ncbi:uncharacterized protein LOC127882367 [Dreissena polymorpha]|uniref:Enoyl-CoA hydratase/isomerase family protein n=1 Tax=Dreissena polymorpha TaxID=45954 RepID=A0A9D4GVB0_DREPO|nr:uncharacterized protein LOC127882367 [Dreissena polymorpha]KAH3824386.1 hypothetical protein DPMN_126221 [Dreissena polymorpha]
MDFVGLSVRLTDEDVAVVTMCNGDNTFTLDYVRTWNQALDFIDTHPKIVGIITTGEGRSFSTGLDVDWLKAQTAQALDEYHEALHKLYKRILAIGITTVAAVNGHAIAEGAFIALVHDFRLMREDRGWVQWPEVHMKLPFTKTMVDIFKLKVPCVISHREALVFGKRLDAKRGVALGIIDRAVPAPSLMSEALVTLQKARGNMKLDRHFFGVMKEDLYTNYIRRESSAAKL